MELVGDAPELSDADFGVQEKPCSGRGGWMESFLFPVQCLAVTEPRGEMLLGFRSVSKSWTRNCTATF